MTLDIQRKRYTPFLKAPPFAKNDKSRSCIPVILHPHLPVDLVLTYEIQASPVFLRVRQFARLWGGVLLYAVDIYGSPQKDPLRSLGDCSQGPGPRVRRTVL
uniref:Uncharacterized protein n=1 Tax=Anguilla anguilla TaxID=7936 RepID=A0A0E9WFR1_ANGAN